MTKPDAKFMEKCRTIQVGKDQLWCFRKRFSPTDVVEIHSKRQFERECVKRGQVQVTMDDLTRHGAPYQPPPVTVSREQIARAFYESKRHRR